MKKDKTTHLQGPTTLIQDSQYGKDGIVSLVNIMNRK